MNHPSEPIARDAYEKLARAYAEKAEAKAENGYNEYPAMRTQIGEVDGLRILDAGCGPGFLARDLLRAGAHSVVAVDVSPTMIDIAGETLADSIQGGNAEVHVLDLGLELPIESAGFDLVVSSLALDYVRDWSVPLGEFRRLLVPGGRVVFSVQHPQGSYAWFRPPSAFGVHYCEAQWKGFTDEPVTVPDFYRSIGEILNPLLASGFRLRAIQETRPVETLRAIDPAKYERGQRFPTFLILDAESPAAANAIHDG